MPDPKETGRLFSDAPWRQAEEALDLFFPEGQNWEGSSTNIEGFEIIVPHFLLHSETLGTIRIFDPNGERTNILVRAFPDRDELNLVHVEVTQNDNRLRLKRVLTQMEFHPNPSGKGPNRKVGYPVYRVSWNAVDNITRGKRKDEVDTVEYELDTSNKAVYGNDRLSGLKRLTYMPTRSVGGPFPEVIPWGRPVRGVEFPWTIASDTVREAILEKSNIRRVRDLLRQK